MGLYGTITGKALYEGAIDLEKLLQEELKSC
jgi:phosphoribosylformimino-5-aminoimidazole carboxamide ribotide isomerase